MPDPAGQPWLTGKGWTLTSFVCVFGALGILLTLAVLHALWRDPQWAAAAALLPCAATDVAVALVARVLIRDRTLVRSGQLARGRVVALLPTGGWGVVYYEFPDDGGRVKRGKSTLSARTRNSPHWQIALGSGVDVLSLPGRAQRNALWLSLSWER